MSGGRRCSLCGRAGTEEEIPRRMVRWRDPLPGALFDTITRCRDTIGCRERLEAAGDGWPVDDGTPATGEPVTFPPSFDDPPDAAAAVEIPPAFGDPEPDTTTPTVDQEADRWA